MYALEPDQLGISSSIRYVYTNTDEVPDDLARGLTSFAQTDNMSHGRGSVSTPHRFSSKPPIVKLKKNLKV